MKQYKNKKNKYYNRGFYKVQLEHIGNIYPSANAAHYRYAKNYLKFKDYRYARNADELKSEAVSTLRKTKPYAKENCLNISIKPLNTSIDVSFRVRCYSGKNHSDNKRTDNLPKYIYNNFHSGDVVLAKLIDTNGYSILLTNIKRSKSKINSLYTVK